MNQCGLHAVEGRVNQHQHAKGDGAEEIILRTDDERDKDREICEAKGEEVKDLGPAHYLLPVEVNCVEAIHDANRFPPLTTIESNLFGVVADTQEVKRISA
jgi:hypothetical protein